MTLRNKTKTKGFTLLELVIAVTILAVFLLPMMLIITNAKVRAIKYTQERQIRDLAQRKLFDVIHYRGEEGDEWASSGYFDREGQPTWFWEVPAPVPMTQDEPVLLEYQIVVTVPQKLEGSSQSLEEDGSSVSISAYAFADALWYDEQARLYESGQYSPLYGDPTLGMDAGGGY